MAPALWLDLRRMGLGGLLGRRTGAPGRRSKRRLALLLTATGLAVLGAALALRGFTATRPTRDLTTWHGAFAFEPGPLDPTKAVSTTDGAVSALIYSGLVRFDEEGRVIPDLAQDWDVSEDGLAYTFRLRSGIRFHDGTAFDASDVIFSFRRVLDPATGSSRSWVLSAVKGARGFARGRAAEVAGLEAPDSLTVKITLDAPLAHFPALLAMPAGYIVSPEAVARWGPDFGHHPVGTGPWVLESWREGIEIRLSANGDYFDRPARLERLVYRFIPDSTTRQAEFEAGNLEVLTLGEENADYFARNPRFAGRLRQVPELGVVYVALNCAKPPLDNVLVRRALNHAVNRQALLEATRPGRYVLAEGSVPPGLAGHHPSWGGYEYNPSLARSLLARAGYPNGLTMDLVVRAGGLGVFLAEPIQAELDRVGVRVRIVQLETQAFFAAVSDTGNPDACILSWVADYPDPENFLFPLFHSSNGPSAGNSARFADPVADRLMDAIHRETDPERRAVLAQAAERAVFERAPWIPLYFPIDLVVCQPEVRGLRAWPIYNANKMTDVWLDDSPAAGEAEPPGGPEEGGP